MSSISRRKLSSTEDFLKFLADAIRQEKMGLKGADKGYTLNFLEIIPQKITPVDVLSANPNTQSIGETATPTDVTLSYTETAGSFHIAFGNDATLFGVTWTATSGKYRGGTIFDGDDYTRTTTMPASFNAITVACWIVFTQINTNNYLISDLNDKYTLSVYLNKLRFSVYDTADRITDGVSTITTGQWYHLVGTYDGSKVRVYVNGIDDQPSPTSASGAISPSATVDIGGKATVFANGTIDEVSVYNRALSSSEIISAYNGNITKDGMVLYLSFDEGSGSSSIDQSGALIEYSEIA